MSTWLVRIIAAEAYMGDPADPLIWARKVFAASGDEAMAQVRRDPNVPHGAPMIAIPEGQW